MRAKDGRPTPSPRQLVVGLVGGLVTVAGLVLMPLPGPGILVVLAGLAILASEFDFARHLLAWGRERARSARRRTPWG
ncbi:MAG: PGPGW domain-containing protein [Actinobacteria bacterium]|nr:PGPGW domain-containing protein [Actinomycetota bacterium]